VTASQVRSSVVSIELVSDPLVDVDFCATHAHNTGIQRVVRSTVPKWSGAHVLAAWSPDGTGYRRLTPSQESLVTAWHSGARAEPADTNAEPLLVPVDGAILLPEVPALEYIARLASIARFSGNRVGLIGYDAIPVVSADTVSDDESDRFAHYLEVVKHANVVSCISETTADEFRSLNSSFEAQGIRGPSVLALPLPEQPVGGQRAAEHAAPVAVPLVLMVGSLEPRKNQLGVLSASRILWERGAEFELQFIGGGSAWFIAQFDREVDAVRRLGYPVSVRRGVSDSDLAAAYRAATVFVFPSLQEGYGLPIVEALATGTPVITSNYGSMAEIAQGGGCLSVDPRDDDAIADAIERLLVDPVLRESLIAEAAARQGLTWAEYAGSLWRQFMEPVA
jgi:glycosyltransferase involved in cell wall biosynthesis